MILWLLLFSQLALADDPVIEEYCFASAPKMKEVSGRLKFILVPADKLQENANCFTVATPPHRRELIQGYIRRLEPAVQIAFSSVEIKRDPCEIKVEKQKTKRLQNTAVGVDVGMVPSASTEQVIQDRNDVTKIQTLKDFELTVNQDIIKGECRVINANRYEINIEVIKEARPLIPPVPAGTVVLVPDAQIPKDQETSRLQTTLQLNRGERIELGNVVGQLKNNGKKIDLDSGVGLELNQGTQSEKIFLSID
jgi:hypothetical protein